MDQLKGFMLPLPFFTFLLYSLHTPLTLNKVFVTRPFSNAHGVLLEVVPSPCNMCVRIRYYLGK